MFPFNIKEMLTKIYLLVFTLNIKEFIFPFSMKTELLDQYHFYSQMLELDSRNTITNQK